MSQNTGQSRGNQKNKQFIQDSANSFVVEAFRDVALTAPVSPVDGEGYIVDSGAGSLHASWGTITGLQDKDIIRYRASNGLWQIALSAVAANEGSESYVKDDDILYVFDGGDWNVASGAGGGVKNFAQKQATSYKVADWTSGNSASFGASGTISSVMSVETVAPLDGKKSFKITTGASTENDWVYLTVDIDPYARGSAIAFTFDYQWDGEEDIKIHVTNPALSDPNLYGTELNAVKNTSNDYKLSRNSRTIYAHPDTESQVLVGFQFPAGITPGKEFIFDLVKVTDDIGTIGTGSGRLEQSLEFYDASNGFQDNTDELRFPSSLTSDSFTGDDILTIEDDVANTRTKFVAAIDCVVEIEFSGHSTVSQSSAHIIKGGGGTAGPNVIRGDENGVAGRIVQVAGSLRLKKGEFFTIHMATKEAANSSNLHITATAEEEGLRFLQVPNGEKLKDTFSARIINNGTATIESDPHGFIESVFRNTPGQVYITFKPGFFAVTPSIVGTASKDASGEFMDIMFYDESAGGCKTFSWDTSPFGATDRDFNITVTRQVETPDIIGVPVSIQGQTHEQDSCIVLNGGNGFGSTSTRMRRFTNIEKTLGSAVTYVDDAVDGARFEIQESGVYSVSWFDVTTDTNAYLAITKNQTDLTIAAGSLPVTEKLVQTNTSNEQGEQSQPLTWTEYLFKGDVVRCSTGGAFSSSTSDTKFAITKVGTQPLLDGGLVERPGSTLTLRGGNGTTVGSGNATRRFSNIENSQAIANGDVSYVDDATEGSIITILEDGVYGISYLDRVGASNAYWGISLNQTDLTVETLNLPPAEILCMESGNAPAGDYIGTATTVVRLNKGDVLRPSLHNMVNMFLAYNQASLTITKLGQTVKYSSRVYKEDPIAWQDKVLSANVVSTGAVTDLTFNNLEIGKSYEIIGQVSLLVQTAGGPTGFIKNGSTIIAGFQCDGNAGTQAGSWAVATGTFVATATTVYLEMDNATASDYLEGDGTKGHTGSWLQLREKPFDASTSKWT